MDRNHKTLLLVWLTVLASLLNSCGPVTPAFPSATTTASIPTAATVMNDSETSLFEVGKSYSDPAGDMEVGFLDVVRFQGTVDEEAETLQVILHMRDIPPTAPRGAIIDFAEYMLDISMYSGPSTVNPVETQPDYGFMVLTTTYSPTPGEGIQTPKPGKSEIVPIEQLWDVRSIYDATGENIGTVDVVVDPDEDTLTITGRVPGISSEAGLRFYTLHYGGTKDTPDSNRLVTRDLASPVPEPLQPTPTLTAANDGAQLLPAGTVRAYPGPEHYAGDVLTFEILSEESFDGSVPVTLTLDDQDPVEAEGQSLFDRILLPRAIDTTELIGPHTVRFATADGSLNETYSFEVLPASERPANEENAVWRTTETACCVFHYISETAAARDIQLISENFQQGAEDFSTITGGAIDPRMDVYIMDRIWGNGGFGGNGELVISYTDRYYGPTIGAAGLQTPARHEFTHAANIDRLGTGDGVEFNYEGLAVYVAGGHYKPEPLAQRGAALYDLGYAAPVGQLIEQHELSYLHAAAILTYIDDAYGPEEVWEFLRTDANPDDDQPGPLEPAIQATFGMSLVDFDRSFQAWLEAQEPGEQLEDLRLTIALQDLRRSYQDMYAPPPYFLLASAADAAARPEYLPVVIREANAAPNAAIELIIAAGQQAIAEQDYSRAEDLIAVLQEVLSTGRFENPLAKDYLDIALVLEAAGYTVASLDLQGDQAIAQVSAGPPVLTTLELQRVNGIWGLKS